MVDFVAAMVEANRTIYRDKDKVIPIMVAATQKPREAVEYAWDLLTKNCIWSVNEGLRARAHPVDHRPRRRRRRHRRRQEARGRPGDRHKIASDGVAAAGGRADIHGCKL